MTSLTIELSDEQKAALAAKAQARGLSTEQYALKVLEHDLVPEWLQKSWKTSREAGLDQLSMEEIDAEISQPAKRVTNPGYSRVHDSRRSRHERPCFGVAATPGPSAQLLLLALNGSIRLCITGSIYAEYEESSAAPGFSEAQT